MMQDEQLKKLRKIIFYAKEKSEFYRAQIPLVELNNLDRLSEIPILTGATLRREASKKNCSLLTSKRTNCYVFASGGTTGTSKYIYRTPQENEVNARYLAKGLKLSGLVEKDCVLNLLSAGDLWAGMIVFNKVLEKVGVTILPVGNSSNFEHIIKNIDFFKVTAILGIPTQIISLANYIQQQKLKIAIPKIVTGGEHLYPSAKEYLKRILQVERFISTGYTSSETGAIGYQCSYCQDNLFHLHSDLQHLEIVDLKNHQPVRGNEIGAIVVTNLHRKLMPIIRYAVGDIGYFRDEKCPCGSQDRRFELLGRCDDKVRLGTSHLSSSDIAYCISTIPELSLHFQIEIRLKQNIDLPIVIVEALNAEFDVESLQQKLVQNIIDLPDISEEINNLLMHVPMIKIVPPDTIPRNKRTGKISRINDLRGKPLL